MDLAGTTAARGRDNVPEAEEVIVAYSAPHDGAVTGMIMTTKSGARILTKDVETVAMNATGAYRMPSLKSSLPMETAIDLP